MRRRFVFASASLATVCCASLASAQSSTESYTYDELGRLVTVVTSGGQNNTETQSICYDAAGNRTEYRANASNGATLCPPVPQAATVAAARSASLAPLFSSASTPAEPNMVLTGPDLTVLPEHSSTYRCALVNRPDLGIYSGGCWLIANDVAVYQSEDGSVELDTGYSLRSPGVLQVAADRYGTGEAP